MGIFRRRRAGLEAAAADVVPPGAPPSGELGRWTVAGRSTVGPWSFAAAYVTRGDAMAVPTLAFIRNQMAGGIASMPLERFRVDAKTGAETPITGTWCDDPDVAPAIPHSLFWSWLIDDLFFNGKSTLIVLARDSGGWPIWFRRVLPGQLTYDPETLALGTLTANLTTTYLGEPIPPGDIVVINGPHEGICNYGSTTIRQALDLEAGSARNAAEPVPNIDLHQTGGEALSKDKAKQLVADWAEARQGGATSYTPANLEAKPIAGYSSVDMQAIEGRQYMATQTARMAGVNPVLVSAAMGAASSYVYTNQADYRQAFLDDVLDAYLQAIEGRLSAADVTPRGQKVRFDRDAYTRMPLSQRIEVMLGAMKSAAAPGTVNQLADLLDIDLHLPESDDQPAINPPPPPAPAPTAPPARPRPTPAAV
jgi:Phage portal protein